MKLADLSINRVTFAAVLNLVLVVVGVMAYPRIGLDLFPSIDVPFVTVRTIYPGADPAAVESKVSEKLEERLSTLSGLQVIKSYNLENVSLVTLEFDLGMNVDQAAQDARDKVAEAIPDMPDDVEAPVVAKFDIGASPIMSLALSGNLPVTELTRVADDEVKARLQRLPGVGSIDLVGSQEREIQVQVNREKLASYGLTVADVAQILVAQNLEVPGGRLIHDNVELAVKVKGEVDTAEAIGAIIITSARGAPVRIRDVAEVVDGAEEARSAADLDGKPAISLVVRKQSGANTVEVAHRVRAELAAMAPTLPKGLEVGVPVDGSLFVEASMNDVQHDLLIGALLTVLIVMFFLRDFRATLIAAIALPTSIIATVGFMKTMDFTFNNMTMLALTLSTGILIDDAIVVIENIHRHLEMGKTPKKAAADATGEIGLAVMAITASIVAVFLPVATMKGIVGRFFYQFGMTVSFSVAVSLLVSFTLTPMLSSRFLKHSHDTRHGLIFRAIEWLLAGLEAVYRRILSFALRQRLLVIVIALASFGVSIHLLGLVKKEFMPEDDRGEFNVMFETPAGTPLAETVKAGGELRQAIATVPGVTHQFTTIGAGDRGAVNKGQIHVELVAKGERAFTTKQAIDHVRTVLGERDSMIISVEKMPMVEGGGMNKDIMFNLQGPDLLVLEQTAQKMIAELKKRGGYADLDITYRTGKPELDVVIDRERAAEVGVPVAIVATTVRSLIAGDKLTDIPMNGDRVNVRLQLAENQRQDANDILGMHVRGASGRLVELSNLVKTERTTGPTEIERQSRQRQVTLTGNLKGKTMGDAKTEIEEVAKSLVTSDVITGWDGTGKRMAESFGYMLEALILAIILVYLILAAQFDSFIHPITIMISLPLSFIGALGGLVLFGMSMSIFTMIGVIMLMGLVIKNAVLLVDFANQERERGVDIIEALITAGAVRLRPILMTTAAMVGGMVPVAMALSLGGEQRAPMAVAVIGGLLTSTLLTLVVVPVVYTLMDKLRRTKKKTAAPVSVMPEPEAA